MTTGVPVSTTTRARLCADCQPLGLPPLRLRQAKASNAFVSRRMTRTAEAAPGGEKGAILLSKAAAAARGSELALMAALISSRVPSTMSTAGRAERTATP